MLLTLLMNLEMFGGVTPPTPVVPEADTHDAPPWTISTLRKRPKKRIKEIVEEIEEQAPEPMKEAVRELLPPTPDWGLIAQDIQLIALIMDIYDRMLRDREVAQLLALED